MANRNSRKTNLIQQKAAWVHLPTKAIRVPACFASALIAQAQAWDQNRNEPTVEYTSEGTLTEQLKTLSLEELLDLQEQLGPIIKANREATMDRRLERAILHVAARCDGASLEDGTGFNTFDAGFGHWLAERIESGVPLLNRHASAALEMMGKYWGQLSNAGLELPSWETITHQYPPSAAPVGDKTDELPIRRIELHGDRVAVFAPYDPTGTFQRQARGIASYQFERQLGNGWFWPADSLDEVIEVFPAANGYVVAPEVDGLLRLREGQRAAEQVERERKAECVAQETLKLIERAAIDQPLPNGWALYEHQQRGVEWLLAHRRDGIYRGGILADHMGLGKTLEALVAAKAITQSHENAHVLVVCPASLRENWAREAEKVEVPIETWSWAKMPEPFEKVPYIVIADEAHYSQNLKSRRTQALLSLTGHDNCLAVWLLTGTPIKNGRPVNLYPLLLACGHPLAEDQRRYEDRYCAAYAKSIGRERYAWDVTGASHLDELSVKTEDVILRRTKDVCLDLPPKIRTPRPAELSAKEMKAFNARINELVADYQRRAAEGEVDPAAEALVTLNIMRQVGSQYKTPTAVDIAEQLLEQDQPVVLFTEFVDTARTLHHALGGELLVGRTKAAERQAIVDRFQSGASRVFVGTVKAAGVGLTLTAASYVILVDRPWTPGDTEQAEDRCHRIGAEHTVHSFWIELGVIDEALDQLIETKSRRIELMLRGKRKTLRGLRSPREFARELLELL